jgi:hypothetical protein
MNITAESDMIEGQALGFLRVFVILWCVAKMQRFSMSSKPKLSALVDSWLV